MGGRRLTSFCWLGFCALATLGCHAFSNDVTAAGGTGGSAKGGASGSGGTAGRGPSAGASGSTGGAFGSGGVVGSAGRDGSADGGGTTVLAACADALIALDRSCSMVKIPTGFTKSKYAVAQEVLQALTADYDTKMAFGLNAFPPLPGEGTKCDAGKAYVDIALGTSAMIAAAMQSIDPTVPANKNCGTPTGANLEMLASYMPLLASGRRHNIILLTDGMPACDGETVARSVAAISNLRMLGVTTFVVGYVAGSNVSALNMMADAGGQPQSPPAATHFYNAAAPDELSFTLRKILSTICSDIPVPVCPPSAPVCGAGESGCPAGTLCSSGCCFPIIR